MAVTVDKGVRDVKFERSRIKTSDVVRWICWEMRIFDRSHSAVTSDFTKSSVERLIEPVQLSPNSDRIEPV